MKKYWIVPQKNLVSTLILTGLVYLAGFILNLIVVYGLAGGLHDTAIFPLASITSLLSGFMIWIIIETIALKKDFTLAVSMSTTRKCYILTEIYQTVLGSLILYAVCFLLFQLENGIWIPLCYPGFPREPELPLFTTLFGSFSSGVFWVLAFAGVTLGIRLFLGSLFIRFGQIMYWIIWGVWVCAVIFFSHLDSAVLAAFEQTVYHAETLLHGHFLPLLCFAAGMIISCIGVCLLKKQDIRYL